MTEMDVPRDEESENATDAAPDADEQEVRLPDGAVEDLEPQAEEADEVSGGVYNWWKKVEGGGG